IGSAIGIIAGYYGGKTDVVIMQIMDVLLAFPTLILGLLIVAILAGIAGVQFRGIQVKAHLASVVADGRILFHGLEEFYTVNYRYPNATSNPAFNLVTFEPLRTLVGYQGSINARLLNGQADAYDSPDDQGPNQEWWVQMSLAIDPSFQVVIAVSDNVPLNPGVWMQGVYTFEDGVLIAGPGVP
ncbi:MAG: ABC transporter permease subunit, partial [Gemmatimonadetes bacterium]|nr:ABC transporter permease subunit [Gemmatimonadota bacterium]